ncbi:Uncharacterized protein dnm_064830 [Desulfonema magnum]|uniref:Uncharacterized protein n=1 Tax=Desulfonema magnum TaxID=45655 RepID=A0A975BS42_9BACT|nr:Uncharacterized protein dnm_064830 [Desulfonema magnum]
MSIDRKVFADSGFRVKIERYSSSDFPRNDGELKCENSA